jgi:16S rRNA (guanine966-N2)-methyltransferase
MRIVRGSVGGRVLRAPPGADTRPTSEKVREAIFNILPDVEGLQVLDLFAGSGALGIEALSRGAERCVFVESDRAAARVIRENLERTRLTGAVVETRDALALLRDAAHDTSRFDLVLCDPPYGEWAALEGRLAETLPAVLAPAGLLVVETSERVEPQLPLDRLTQRRYGSALITIFRHP